MAEGGVQEPQKTHPADYSRWLTLLEKHRLFASLALHGTIVLTVQLAPAIVARLGMLCVVDETLIAQDQGLWSIVRSSFEAFAHCRVV